MATTGFLFVAVVVVLTFAVASAFPDLARRVYKVMWAGKGVVLTLVAVLVALYAIGSGSLLALFVGGLGVVYIVLSFTVGGNRHLVRAENWDGW